MVGRYVVSYLVNELHPDIYAEVDLQEYIVPHNVLVENGIIYSVPNIKEKIYYLRGNYQHDFLFYYSDFTPASENQTKFCNDFVSFINQLQVTSIITFSGIPSNNLHTDTPKCYIASTTSTSKLFAPTKNTLPKLSFGTIEGLNGVILSIAKDYDIDGFCILCEVPFYTVEMTNPQCAKQILIFLETVFGFSINYNKVYNDIKLMDENLKKIFFDVNEKAQQLFLQFQQSLQDKFVKKKLNFENYDTGITFEELKKRIKFSLPESAKNKINELFKLAAQNIEYAKQLKEELDRWGVYKEYEDKFLSLFLKNKKRKDKET